MANPFFLPNEFRNCKLIEEPKGLQLIYVLPCPSNFNKVSFKSLKNKTSYYRLKTFIPYQNDMSSAIYISYSRLKNTMMLELAMFKQQEINKKVSQLIYKQLSIF